jgi:hypothetical protein
LFGDSRFLTMMVPCKSPMTPVVSRELPLRCCGVPTERGLLGRALLGTSGFDRRQQVVKVIAYIVTGEDLGCHQLRMNIPVPIAENEFKGPAGRDPKLRVGDCDGLPGSAGWTTEDERIDPFGADHP